MASNTSTDSNNVTISDELRMEYRNKFFVGSLKESTLIEWINSHKDVFPTLLVPEFYADNGSGAIHFASQKGYTELVKLLITEYNVDINVLNRNSQTPLYWASCNGRTECVKLLIDAGADVNVADKNGETPLYWASCNGRTECVKLLIDAGADVNIKDNRMFTPLNCIHEFNDIKIVKMLIKAGADVNTIGELGCVPLHTASYERNKEAVKLLIKAGGNVNMKDDKGMTSLDWTLDWMFVKYWYNTEIFDNYIKIIKLLLNTLMF